MARRSPKVNANDFVTPNLSNCQSVTNRLPWFPFYPADWLLSEAVACMSLAERGAYVSLLCRQWHAGGSIPNDDAKLAVLAGCTLEEWTAVKTAVLANFEIEGDRVFNAKLAALEQDSRAKHAERTESGRRGGLAKAENRKRDLSSASQEPVAKASDSQSQSQSQHKEPIKPSAATAAVDERHAALEARIKTFHQQKFGIGVQWDGSEGKALKQLLQANRGWSIEQLEVMVSNRYNSEGITPERPRLWLSSISKYAGGPLDRFEKLTLLPSRQATDTRDYSQVRYKMALQDRGIYNRIPNAADFEPGGALYEYEQQERLAQQTKGGRLSAQERADAALAEYERKNSVGGVQ